MYFQKLLLFNLFEKILDKYPKEKKNKKEAIEAPIPKQILLSILKDFEKFPKINIVSEYTCGFKNVNPKVLRKILNALCDMTVFLNSKYLNLKISLIFP